MCQIGAPNSNGLHALHMWLWIGLGRIQTGLYNRSSEPHISILVFFVSSLFVFVTKRLSQCWEWENSFFVFVLQLREEELRIRGKEEFLKQRERENLESLWQFRVYNFFFLWKLKKWLEKEYSVTRWSIEKGFVLMRKLSLFCSHLL